MKNLVQYWKLLFFAFFFSACGQNQADSQQQTGKLSKNNVSVDAGTTVKKYRYILNDYRGVPVPLVESQENSSPVEAHYDKKGHIFKLVQFDLEGEVSKKWQFEFKNETITRIKYRNLHLSGNSRTEYYSSNSKDCARFYDHHGLEIDRRCWQKLDKGKLKEEVLNQFDYIEGKSLLKVNSRGLIEKRQLFTRYGALKGIEKIKRVFKNSEFQHQIHKMQPGGATIKYRKIKYDSLGRKISIIFYYHDKSIKSRTDYKYLDKYRGKGVALTEEGIKYQLEFETDKLKNLLEQKKFLGNRLVEHEKNKFNNQGRRVYHLVKSGTGKILEKDIIKYKKDDLISEYIKYRGNIHKFSCFGEKGSANVSTRLPALETVDLQYDILGRISRLQRKYLEQPVDIEKISYGTRNKVESRKITFSQTGEKLIRQYTYDHRGLLAEEKISNGKNGELFRYTRDNQGKLIKEQILKLDGTPPSPEEMKDGSVIRYSYDKKGRMIEKQWFYPDGKPALTKNKIQCSACTPPGKKKTRAIGKITYAYNGDNLLISEQEFGNDNKLLYRSDYEYTGSGYKKKQLKKWPLENKSKQIVQTYDQGGWTKSVTMEIKEGEKSLFREIRRFDRSNLVYIARFKDGVLQKKVSRKYEKGLLQQRKVETPEKTVVVNLKRNSGGKVIEEKAVDEKGKPTLATDAWNNKYTESFQSYYPDGRLEYVVYKNSLENKITRVEFSWSKSGYRSGRKVLKNNELKLVEKEFSTNKILSMYGVHTHQLRTVIDSKGKRKTYAYKLKINPANLSKSVAEIKLPEKSPTVLSECKCMNCGFYLDYSKLSRLE
ncbi:MAG: hypothetical protein PF689_06975 [Deltaproteobacteria bacterium]|jgi:hypothetical protein|nr:hypothetical protein [Deltaproteobacteria bacterium]